MKPETYKISVLICTHNRAEMLREALSALAKQVLREPAAVEVLVVDNASTDSTRQLADEFSRKMPWPLSYLFEANKGVNYARNSGLKSARGQIVAMLDADVIPLEGWLQGMLDVFETCQPDAAGGRISPLYLQEPPAWFKHPEMTADLDGVLGRLDLGPEILIAEKPQFNIFFGANMAFRKSVFEEVGYFRVDLGIKAGKRGLSGETELLQRLFRCGKKIAYTPHAHVLHKVTPRMVQPAYVRAWKFNKGRSVSLSSESGRPLEFWLLKECLRNGAASLISRSAGESIKARKLECRFWIQWGQIAGSVERTLAAFGDGRPARDKRI